MESGKNTCPRCGGRLVSGAKNCLHCGSLVAPGKSESSGDGGGDGVSIMTIIIVLLVILGGGFFLLVGTGGSKAVDVVNEPIKFGGEGGDGNVNVTSTTCVPEGAEAQIADLQSQGWEEIDGKDGMRCFRD